MAKIIIPTALRQYTAQADQIDLAGGTVNDLLTSLTERYPDLHKHLYNEQNRLRNFVNIYLNDEDVRYLQKGATEVSEGDTIYIIPAIAGGASGIAVPRQAQANGHEDETELSREEIRRYSRHLIVPEVGMEGQKKLKTSSVLLIGA